ncbi:MAG TPA: flagellar hook-associated protein FlgL [Burkholderiaceae bacterium]|nr:flagellar hook-associated protein FlgL [Burkholderiaceae bacterium]
MRMSTSMLNEAAVTAMLQEQADLAKTQNQLSTGKSINSPADNPVAAVQILELTNSNSQVAQYVANGQSANSRLTLQEQALSDSTTTLQSVRDLIVQANSGSNSSADFKAIATQVQSLEQQLQGIANRQDQQGDYLFSGYSTGTQPFVRSASGAMSYMGDCGARSIQLDGGTSVQLGDPGSAIYMGVATGNGTFTTAASSANAGTGVVDAGSVTDKAAWVAGQYTITFTDATHWQVTDGAGNPVLDASGNPVTGIYNGTSGSVAFNGIQVGISGAPAAGDAFTVSPSGRESIFDTLDRLVSALDNAGSSSAAHAQLSSALGASLQQIDQSLAQVSRVTSNVGARLSLIGTTATALNTQSTTVSGQISDLSDVNYVAATAQYSRQYLALQAAQASFAQIGQLSLFKYL